MIKRVGFHIVLILIGAIVGGAIAIQGLRLYPAGSGESDSPQISTTPYRTGPFKLGVSISPEKPVVGDNTLQIILHTRDDKPVTGANISAIAEMPAMGSMPAMRAPAEMQETRPGVYVGPFELSMEGAWPLTIKIEKPEAGSARVSFDMGTDRIGLELSSGATDTRGESASPDVGKGTEAATPPGTITVDSRRRQLIGVKTGKATLRPLKRTIRAYGQVVFDERRVSDVNLKYEAWIDELKADSLGASVRRGEVLFTIFSPDLYAAQQEYLDILRRRGQSDSSRLVEGVVRRLRFWGMTSDQIKGLATSGRALEFVPIFAPQSGTVIEKNVVTGSGVKAGETLLRIADLSEVWVEAEVYEADIPLLSKGMSATVKLPYMPGETRQGRVEFIYPYLESETRTGRLRLSFPNPDGALKPHMYTEVTLEASLGEVLAVPEEAVIIAGGDVNVVFEDLGNGQLAPRRVRIGRRANGYIEILSGLEPEDRIVISGNFLIASESRLRAGLEQWQ